MIREILFLIFIAFSACTNAQVHWNGIWIYIDHSGDNQINLRVKFESNKDQKISSDAKILFKLSDDSVLELKGSLLSTGSQNGGAVVIGNIAVPINQAVSEAVFNISNKQLEYLINGNVKKFRINTIPKIYTKKWNNNWFSRRLKKEWDKVQKQKFDSNF